MQKMLHYNTNSYDITSAQYVIYEGRENPCVYVFGQHFGQDKNVQSNFIIAEFNVKNDDEGNSLKGQIESFLQDVNAAELSISHVVW